MDEIEWRTIQFFISEDGVCEVLVDSDDPTNLRCTCPAATNNRCKHIRFIKDKTRQFGGHYTIKIPAEISEEEAILAVEDPSTFRDFLIKYGRPEEL
jgi:hypothetical protein